MAGFDDVSFHIVEEPEPPRRPRRTRRLVLAAAATALGVGAIATGASALTSSSEPAKAPAAAKQERHFVRFHHSGRHHGPCPNMGGKSAPSSAAFAPRD
jgi:hypothetical protein